MGAEFNYYTSDLKPTELSSYHLDYQSQARSEFGIDTYGGHLGTLEDGLDFINAKPFKTADEASDYILDNHNKWDCAMAVPYEGKVNRYDKKSEKVAEQLNKAEHDLVATKRKIIQQMKNTKSKNIGCKNCGSSISRKHLDSADCPVCHKRDIFYSATQKKTLVNKAAKVLKLKSAKMETVEKTGTCYVVGGWCPS